MKRYIITLTLMLSLLIGGFVLAQDTPTPLDLTDVAPTAVPEGQDSMVIVRGAGFDSTMTISLEGMALTTTVSDASTATITVPQTVSAGTYDVTATNGDASTVTLDNALQVIELPMATSSEPRRIQQGTEGTLSVFGSNFDDTTLVRLEGYGLLQTTFVNSGVLTAIIPSSVPARDYPIVLVDGNGATHPPSPALLLGVMAAPTDVPPTLEPLPMPTQQSITTAPLLMLSSFTTTPSTIDAGQTVNISFTVTNRGNDTARAISIALESSSSFVPAAGQASVVLPDLAAGASATGQMTVASSLEVTSGPVVIPLAMSYQNFTGESFTGSAELSVTVRETANTSQLIVDAYTIEPSPAEAGQAVTLRLTIFNVGDTPASQVLLRVGGENSLLLPNGRGDAIPLGDIGARETIPVEIPMLVSASAENGPQVQPLTISYYQNGETQEMSSNITLNISSSTRPLPLLLLSSYDIGVTSLQPGTRFTLTIDVQNAGRADARNTVITFGTVQTTGDSGSGSSSGNGNGNGSGSGSGSSTTPSTTFAPLGTAGLSFVGDIGVGDSVQASQDFIVSGSVTSGIYPLPITLQYILPDGTNKQDSLNISLVVIVPPRLQFSPDQPLPETLNTNEAIPISLEIKNNGRDVNLTEAVFAMENGEILEGESIPLEVLKTGDDMSITALIMPSQDGDVQVSVTLHYLDELNQAQTIELTYLAQAITPPPVEEPPFEEPPVIVEPEPEVNWFGRFMMALLGLGS
jgi:hypothetical protein